MAQRSTTSSEVVRLAPSSLSEQSTVSGALRDLKTWPGNQRRDDTRELRSRGLPSLPFYITHKAAFLPFSLFRRRPSSPSTKSRDGRVTYRIDYVVEGQVGQGKKAGRAGQKLRHRRRHLGLCRRCPPSLPSSYCPTSIDRKPKDKKIIVLSLIPPRSHRRRWRRSLLFPSSSTLGIPTEWEGSWAEAKMGIVLPDASAMPNDLRRSSSEWMEVEIYAASHAFWRSLLPPLRPLRPSSPILT